MADAGMDAAMARCWTKAFLTGCATTCFAYGVYKYLSDSPPQKKTPPPAQPAPEPQDLESLRHDILKIERMKSSKYMNGDAELTSGISKNGTIAEQMEILILEGQKSICAGLTGVELDEWRVDEWTRPNDGGGGVSCVIAQDKSGVFEKAGINVSVVNGMLTEQASRSMTTNHPNMPSRNSDGTLPFKAMGISSVMHPHNPHAPTIHFNFRYFEVTGDENTRTVWWFGGGIDLTPSYLYPEDCAHFHQVLKNVCDKHNRSYGDYKQWCDKYFCNTHRGGERRGIGGVFFDDLSDAPAPEVLNFIRDMQTAVLKCYNPILDRRISSTFTPEEKRWQAIRRGRYVEFNLIHDRGTKFGLFTPGSRIESILVSLPRYASWEYSHEPEEGSREAELLKVCRNPAEWIK